MSELRRRNVYKVAVAYAVIAWLLIQAGSILFPTFEAPGWVMKVFVTIIAAGFPIALVMAWAFEMTPEGIKRTENVPPNEFNPQWTRRQFAMLIASVGIVAGGLLLLQFTRWNPAASTSNPAQREGVSDKSIAVLPFENLSGNPENAYFTDGIQEEILTRLAKIADLKVISRTSTARYKSSPDNLREIAKQLGVAHILEGSVQRAADQVRVNVQLINAATDAHLWAESFDRQLNDIFRIESEIAKTIADTLQAKLTGLEQHAIAAQPTQNTEAHQLYLKGTYFWNKRTGPDLRKAIEYFNQAIEKDPNYALAYAGLADAWVLIPSYAAATPKEGFLKAEAAARKAIALDATLGEAHASMANVLCLYEFDFAESEKEFKRAIELNPNYATAHHWYGGNLLGAIGQFDRAIAESKRAQELDPLSLIIDADVGATYLLARRYDEAIDHLRRTIEMDPRFYFAHWNLGEALQLKGQLREAVAEYKKAAQLDDDPFMFALIAQGEAKLGQRDEALKLLARLERLATRRYVDAYCFALVHIALGENDKAIGWLERAYNDRAGNDLAFIKVDPMLDPLRGDPRFEALVQKVFGPKNATQTRAQSL